MNVYSERVCFEFRQEKSVPSVMLSGLTHRMKGRREEIGKGRAGGKNIYIYSEVMKFEVLKAVKKSIFDTWWLYWRHCLSAMGNN
jgi:hypothetical protein